MNSVIYSPASTNPDDAYKYITKRNIGKNQSCNERNSEDSVDKVSENGYYRLLGRTVVTDDTDVLMRDFRGYAQTKKLPCRHYFVKNTKK